MTVAEYIAFLIIGIYSLTIFHFFIGWIKLKTFNSSTVKNLIPISIIVACRNEEKNISSLLDSLINQTYSKEKTEIIIIDDHSEDNTTKIIAAYVNKYCFIRLLELPNNKTGKKEALAYGITNSTSDIIITTDADCIMNKYWLITLVNYYNQFKPKLLVGSVVFNYEKNTFQKLQALEFLSLVGSGAGAIGINHAIMNNGANLLFEKSAFLESNQHNKYASGDDVFFMLHVKKNYKKAIHFVKSKNTIVYTNASKSVNHFFNQRIRWTSKSKAYRDFDILYTAIVVTSTSFILIFSFIYAICNHPFIYTFILLFIIKSIFDLSILIPASRFFYQQKLLWLFFPLQVIYPFYIVFTVFYGLLGNFNWKGRNFQEKG